MPRNLAWCGGDHLTKCREAKGQLEKRRCRKHGDVGGRELKSEAPSEQSLLTPGSSGNGQRAAAKARNEGESDAQEFP